MDKVKDLPKIYWINMKEAEERSKTLLIEFTKFNLKNKRIEAIVPSTLDSLVVRHKTYSKEDIAVKAQCCTSSHFLALKTFIEDEENKDDTALIAEDDLSFETTRFWSNNWKDYISQLPADYEIAKLCVVSLPHKSKNYCDKYYHQPVKVNGEYVNGSCIYIIKRSAAEKIVNSVYDKDVKKFNLNFGVLLAEDIFRFFGNSYYFPLFIYRTQIPSYIRNMKPGDRRFEEAAMKLIDTMKKNK